jgi:acetyl esterase/lipase
MRYLREIVAGAGFTLLAAITVGLWFLLGETNLDRAAGDYRSRMHSIWAGPPPGTPDSETVPLDIDSAVLRYLFVNELDSEVPYLVAFPAAGATRAPALLILPGGGYAFRSEKLDGLDLAGWFSERGIASFVLNYRVDPYRYPVPLQDAERAMRWLRAHADEQRIDPRRLGVLGSSAGGHLAALLATRDGAGNPDSEDPVEHQSSKPDVLILSQAVVSFRAYVHEGSRRRLLGNSPAANLLDSLSAENRVTPSTPPSFVWTTRTDEFVDYRNSELFVRALNDMGIDHEFQLFPEGPHGRGLARAEKYARQWPQLCLDWLARHGFISQPAARARVGVE